MRTLAMVAAAVLLTTGAVGASAEEKPWKLSLGLSYLATSGNSDSQTAGLDVSYVHDFKPWGVEATGSFLRAESSGQETVRRLFAGVRGTRALGERWKVFLGASGLQDRYAGLDRRTVVEGGVTLKALATERHTLSVDGGAAWTRDELVEHGGDDYLSAVAGLAYAWKISETASFSQRLAGFPSFEDGSDWRLESDTALEAALTSRLAVKLGYALRYDNLPVPGFKKTDTRSSVSLVIGF